MKKRLFILMLLLPLVNFAQQADDIIYGIEGFYNVHTLEGKKKIKGYLVWRIERKGDELTKHEADKIFNPKNKSEFEELQKSIERFENPEFMTVEEIRELLKDSKYRGYIEDNRFQRAENNEPKYIFPKESEHKKTESKRFNMDKENVYFYVVLAIIFIIGIFLMLRKK